MPLSCNLGTLTSWNPLGHSRPISGLFYLAFYGLRGVTVVVLLLSTSVKYIVTLNNLQMLNSFDYSSASFTLRLIAISIGYDESWFRTFSSKVAFVKNKYKEE